MYVYDKFLSNCHKMCFCKVVHLIEMSKNIWSCKHDGCQQFSHFLEKFSFFDIAGPVTTPNMTTSTYFDRSCWALSLHLEEQAILPQFSHEETLRTIFRINQINASLLHNVVLFILSQPQNLYDSCSRICTLHTFWRMWLLPFGRLFIRTKR